MAKGAIYCSKCGQMTEKSIELNDLARKFMEGDRSAFDAIYEKTIDMVVWKVSSKLDAYVADVNDVVQEIYVSVYKGMLKTYDPSRERFYQWFYVVVEHAIIDYYRKNKNIHENTEPLKSETEDGWNKIYSDLQKFHPDPEETYDHEERNRLIQLILKQISEEQLICIQMFYLDNLKIKEIAQRLNVSENTVKSRLRLGKEKLQSNILTFEKEEGIRLHSVAPLTFLVLLLRAERIYAKRGEMWNEIKRSIADSASDIDSRERVSESDSDVSIGSGEKIAEKAVIEAGTTAAKGIVGKFMLGVVVGIGVLGAAGVGITALLNSGNTDLSETNPVVMETESETENQSVSVDPETIYQAVIQSYSQLFAGSDLAPEIAAEMRTYGNSGVLYMKEIAASENSHKEYTYQDINGDEIPELLIRSDYGGGYNLIDIWTTDGETPKHLINAIAGEEEMVLCENGIIIDKWFGGNLFNTSVYKISENLELALEEVYVTEPTYDENYNENGYKSYCIPGSAFSEPVMTEHVMNCENYPEAEELSSGEEMNILPGVYKPLEKEYAWKSFEIQKESETTETETEAVQESTGTYREDGSLQGMFEGYRKILESYRKAQHGETIGKNEISQYEYSAGVFFYGDAFLKDGLVYNFSNGQSAVGEKIYYAVKDLNNDGYEELIVSPDGKYLPDSECVQVWTTDGQNVFELVVPEYRTYINVYPDGDSAAIVVYEDSGYDDFVIKVYTFNEKGKTVLTDKVESNGDPNAGDALLKNWRKKYVKDWIVFSELK